MRCASWVIASLAALLAACGSPIVGAECRPGFVRCDGACVELENDPAHCGRCGHDCGAFECKEYMCGPGPRPDDDAGTARDAGAAGDAGDAGDAGGSKKPPGIGKGGVGSPFTPDAGFSFPDDSCALGETRCGDICADTQHEAQHCGACGHACGPEQYCIAGECADACEAPLHLCKDQCVDYQTDERNCGACGNVCQSGICDAGVCADVIPGSLVVIGHDYSAASASIPSAMKRLAGNAVLLVPGASVRTLVYRGKAQAGSCDGVIDAIQSEVEFNGRAWQPYTVGADEVTEALGDVDAFVICAQAGATDAEIQMLGQRWALALAQFLYRGGVVALFETATSNNGGTYHLLEPAGLFTAASRESVSPARQNLVVQSPVGIGNHVTPTYRSSPVTVHFVDAQSDATVVVEDTAGLPVVLHRVITP